jgi:hypothetical protein
VMMRALGDGLADFMGLQAASSPLPPPAAEHACQRSIVKGARPPTIARCIAPVARL